MKIILKFSVGNTPCFQMSEEKESGQICVCLVVIYLISIHIQHVKYLYTILPFGLVACTCVLFFSDKLSRNSCILLSRYLYLENNP